MNPSIGRIVHYVQNASHGGTVMHLAAIVTAVFSPTLINAQVFTDGLNSEPGPSEPTSVKWITNIQYDANCGANTWHWPEIV